MGKRYVDHDSQLDGTPTTKKRKTDSIPQTFIDSGIENANEFAADVTYSLTTDVVDGTIVTDLCARKWRCGKPIGKQTAIYLQFHLLEGYN